MWWLIWEGASGSTKSSPCSSGDTQSRVPKPASRHLTEISKEETPQPLNSLYQCFISWTAQKLLPGNYMEPPVLQFVPTACWKELSAPSSWHPFLKDLQTLMRSSLSLPWSKLNRPSSLSLFSWEMFQFPPSSWWPSSGLFPVCCYNSQQTGISKLLSPLKA